MYKYKRVKNQAPLLECNDRFILSIDNHQEIIEALADFAKKQKIKALEPSRRPLSASWTRLPKSM